LKKVLPLSGSQQTNSQFGISSLTPGSCPLSAAVPMGGSLIRVQLRNVALESSDTTPHAQRARRVHLSCARHQAKHAVPVLISSIHVCRGNQC
jgi:hypothetical protein